MPHAWALSAIGVAVISATLLGCDGGNDRTLPAGPLRDTSGNRSWTGGSVPEGTTYVIGVYIPKNKSGNDAVFERLTPSDPRRAVGLRLRYAAVRLPQRGCQIGSAHGWPPAGCRGHVHPVGGFRFPNGADAAQILVGARSTRPGRWFIPAFRLRYSVGDDVYETTYFQGMKLRVKASRSD